MRQAINFVAITLCMVFATILEARPDLLSQVANEKPTENQEIIVLLELPHVAQICLTLWIFMNLVTSLVLSIVLLRGAQERNLGKVRVWFIFTIISHIVWLPILIFWTTHSSEPVNAIFTTLMSYIFGGLSLCVIYSFMEELKIENISHRPGYKNHHVAFNKI
ncbi:uncharacterized protein LOC110858735 isoform X2 [Folsomia candida]|uniref:uncharacterized protein LOC110858735 isoform X2 n=1 Tax=Folsomia candida TaxID=158441 RepID=UPI001604E12E|nr:uncharacterized protein LOC110858735 isoform X2 [Folsomia candida]